MPLPDDPIPEPVSPPELTTRKHPAHGIQLQTYTPTIIFLTVCTKGRKPWLANSTVHELIRSTWQKADAWLVGRYVIMPDHVHLFAAPGVSEAPFNNWVRFWKSHFSRAHQAPDCRWQTDHWNTRMRSAAAYAEKWDYVRYNPARHGLASHPDRWEFQGELNQLRWYPRPIEVRGSAGAPYFYRSRVPTRSFRARRLPSRPREHGARRPAAAPGRPQDGVCRLPDPPPAPRGCSPALSRCR